MAVFCSQPASEMVRGNADTSEMLVIKAKSIFPDLTGSLHCAFFFLFLLRTAPGDKRGSDN